MLVIEPPLGEADNGTVKFIFEGKPHGKGKITYPDGGASSGCKVEEGEWKDGEFVGKSK